MAKIGIIGCGWLGKPLAEYLLEKHEMVECYSRKVKPDEKVPHHLKPLKGDPFWNKDIFIIAISTRDDYLNTLENILKNIPEEAILLFTSSTSVYKEHGCLVDETTPITMTSRQKQAEELIESSHNKTLILRLGGLMGATRIAGRWKSPSAMSDGPVNYIHQDDVIRIISELIKQYAPEGIYNLVAPKHPLRSKVHAKNAKDFGFEPKAFQGQTERIVSSEKIIQALSYDFIHPDPLEFWTSL